MTEIVHLDFTEALALAWEEITIPCQGFWWVSAELRVTRECDHPANWILWFRADDGGLCPRCEQQDKDHCCGHTGCDRHTVIWRAEGASLRDQPSKKGRVVRVERL